MVVTPSTWQELAEEEHTFAAGLDGSNASASPAGSGSGAGLLSHRFSLLMAAPSILSSDRHVDGSARHVDATASAPATSAPAASPSRRARGVHVARSGDPSQTGLSLATEGTFTLPRLSFAYGDDVEGTRSAQRDCHSPPRGDHNNSPPRSEHNNSPPRGELELRVHDVRSAISAAASGAWQAS